MLRRPKLSKIEVVAPKEEEELYHNVVAIHELPSLSSPVPVALPNNDLFTIRLSHNMKV
jgi:hypothetical protein